MGKNIRFVADGKIVSSSGISAAIPTSIALVEAIGGYQNALVLANQVGVTEWSSRHNSDIFQGSPMDPPAPGESLGLPLTGGVDEVAYALTADAYSFTRLSSVFSLAADTKPVRSKHGLMIIPDRVIGGIDPVDFVLPEISKIPVIRAFENALEEIEKRYGEDVAKKVAIFMEYPWKK